jgi:hypothetical protein
VVVIHQHYYGVLTSEQWEDPIWDPENNIQWTKFFHQRHDMELAAYEGNGPQPAQKERRRPQDLG